MNGIARSASQNLLWFPPVSSQPLSLSNWYSGPSVVPDVPPPPPSERSADSGIGTSGMVSPQPIPSKCSLYDLTNATCLTAPYQTPPETNVPLYLYSWFLPSADVLANLAAVDSQCFSNNGEAIGLLFSRPISQNEFVCRVPLYLARGMARARVHLLGQLHLSPQQLTILERAHRILGELLINIGHLSHVGLTHADEQLRQVLDEQSHSTSNVAVRDRFAELEWNPVVSRVLSLVVLLNNRGELNFEAAAALIQWSETRSNHSSSPQSPNFAHPILPVSGILPVYSLRLSQLPESVWMGRIARPCHLNDSDPGIFAIAGASAIKGIDPVKPEMAKKLSRVVNSKGKATASTVQDPVISYVDYFAIKHPSIHSLLDNIDPILPMSMCCRLTRHHNAAQVTAGMRKDNGLGAIDRTVLYLPDTCFVHPLSAWLWFLLSILPVVLHQLSRATTATELHRILFRELADNRLAFDLNPISGPTVLLPDRLNAPRCMLSELSHWTAVDQEVHKLTPPHLLALDQQVFTSVSTVVCPHPNHLLESLTLLAARDAVNLERLEMLGDSLLRLVGTLTVYGSFPSTADEGVMSAKRSDLVSNANLCSIAVRLGWQKYCTAQIFSPPDHFVFPCFTVSSQVDNFDEDSRMVIKLTNKSLADMIEALIGCFLQHCGLRATLKFLSFLGISSELDPQVHGVGGMWTELLSTEPVTYCTANAATPTQLPTPIPAYSAQLASGMSVNLAGLQRILNYTFKNITLLIQALCHPSSTLAVNFGSYQRLEFLGDAVLDFVVTDHLYNTHEDFDPGQLTSSRSKIVNNNTLACALVEHQIHPFITHNHPTLDSTVDFVKALLNRTPSYAEQLELLSEEVLRGLRIKPLADVFESIIGAIFLDSNGSLKIVSDLIHRLLDERIRVLSS